MDSFVKTLSTLSSSPSSRYSSNSYLLGVKSQKAYESAVRTVMNNQRFSPQFYGMGCYDVSCFGYGYAEQYSPSYCCPPPPQMMPVVPQQNNNPVLSLFGGFAAGTMIGSLIGRLTGRS